MTRMDPKAAIEVVHAARGANDVVITTMMPARDWMTLSQNPLDMVLVPSAMSHATSMGLGIALAQPERRVIVCNGDGSMLMNLGSLVSIAAAKATNMLVVVFENGSYDVTGAQPVPGAGVVDFAAIARGSGFASAVEFEDVDSWRAALPNLLHASGPTLVVLRVKPSEGHGPKSPGPAGERAKRLREALQSPA